MLALALVVGPLDRDAGPGRPGHGRVQDLRPIAVAHDLELLQPGGADADDCLVQAGILGAGLHGLALPGRPRARHGVAVSEGPAIDEERFGVVSRVQPLPRHALVLALVPGEAPLEPHAVDSSCRRTLCAAVQEPAPPVGLPVWPVGGPMRAGEVDDGVDGLPLVLVQHDAEPLPPRVPQGDRGAKLPLCQSLHLHHLGPRVPSAGDVHSVTCHWTWSAVVADPGIQRALETQPFEGVDLLSGQVALHAAAPEVCTRVCAPDTKGRDA
mmetsp:Transcript_34654/g.110067  ORF Transcript_34654/g.110067 Transcript_34654/m.110067 type:complete len:268 (-) Transcript_34654:2364-3167(-)